MSAKRSRRKTLLTEPTVDYFSLGGVVYNAKKSRLTIVDFKSGACRLNLVLEEVDARGAVLGTSQRSFLFTDDELPLNKTLAFAFAEDKKLVVFEREKCSEEVKKERFQYCDEPFNIVFFGNGELLGGVYGAFQTTGG